MAHPLHKTARWQRLRRRHLSREPLCRMCKEHGRITAATVVDHVRPHRGDPQVFFDAANLQSLCKPHHDGAKQSQERAGVTRGCGADGVPLDDSHHWSGS